MDKPRILIVGDVLLDADETKPSSAFDEDKPWDFEVEYVVHWLQRAGYHVKVVPSVLAFVQKASEYSGWTVFPLWRGGKSRNRTAIVPAVCEELGLPYVGGDAYVQTVCQDKSLSKALIRNAGFHSPKEVVLRSLDEISAFRPSEVMRGPFVIKPLYSACSIGVSESSLCTNDDHARNRVQELLKADLGPVVCEEFVRGEELSLCLVEANGRLIRSCVGAYRDTNGECPFKDKLFTFEEKVAEKHAWHVAAWQGKLPPSTWEAAERLVRQLGKVDYMRIDGRLQNGEYCVFELTPDIHLSQYTLFVGAFDSSGLPPETLFTDIIQASMRNTTTMQS